MRRWMMVLPLLAACSRPVPAEQPGEPAAAPVDGGAREIELILASLEQADTRAEAVGDSVAAYEDVCARAKEDCKSEEADAFRERAVEPLTAAYVDGFDTLEQKVRYELLGLLLSFEDSRAVPAFNRVLEDFVQDPERGQPVVPDDLRHALVAYQRLQAPEMAPTMLAAFSVFEVHTIRAALIDKLLVRAMVSAPRPEWSHTLIAALQHPMVNPRAGKTPEEQEALADPYRDQKFRQITAAMALGALHDEAAVEPLLRVLLDPTKEPVARTGILTLVRIGEPSIERAAQLLDGKDPLVDFHREARSKLDSGYQADSDSQSDSADTDAALSAAATAAMVIGSVGLPSGREPLLRALKASKNDEQRTSLARQLLRLPLSPTSASAVRRTFEQLPVGGTEKRVYSLKAHMARMLVSLYDSALVPWLLGHADALKGDSKKADASKDSALKDDSKKATQVRRALITTAAQLALPADAQSLRQAAEKHGFAELTAPALAMLDKCRQDITCYLDATTAAKNNEQDKQLAGIKAAYMVALLGDEGDRDALVEALPRIENVDVYLAVCESIEHMTPNGDAKVVDALKRQIAENDASRDHRQIMMNTPMKWFAYRIEARGR